MPTYRSDEPWLDGVAGRVQEFADVLTRLGFETAVHATPGMSSKDLGALVHRLWQDAEADELLVVHVLSHGLLADGGGTVYALGHDGRPDERADVAHWLRTVQTLDGPTVLFLLDLCSSGSVARLPWQQAVDAEQCRAWVVAACPPEQAAYDGRFTQAVTRVLDDLARGVLDVSPAADHVPLARVARAIRQEVNRLYRAGDGYSQRVTASLVDMSADPQIPFFTNPSHRDDEREQLRTTVDPGLLPFLDDLDEGLDARHFLERAAGVGGLVANGGDLVGCFTGRAVQLRHLSRWMNDVTDEQFPPGPLSVVTGSPGVGKSALLGILVCAAHPALRAATRPLWDRDRVAQTPNPIEGLAAVHARRRSLGDIVASAARQLGLGALSDPAEFRRALATTPGPVPLIVIDAVDEANDGPGLAADLLLPLAAGTRRDGRPLARLLVGVRRWDDYAPLRATADKLRTLVDLDAVPSRVLEVDLLDYVQELLRTTSAYWRRGSVIGGFAGRVAATLASAHEAGHDDDSPRWGAFLVAGLYTRHFIATTLDRPLSDPKEAEKFGDRVPRDLPKVLELDLDAQTAQPWLREVMLALAMVQGQGMPASALARVVAALTGRRAHPSPVPPTVSQILDTLQAARVYLRQSVDVDHTTVYRLFHQGLVDYLQPQVTTRRKVAFLDALLGSLGPPDRRDWAAAEPYVVRHAIRHAQQAERLTDLLTDPGFVTLPAAEEALQVEAARGSDEARRVLAVVRSSRTDSAADLALQAARAGLRGLAERAADGAGPTGLAWRPRWSVGVPASPQQGTAMPAWSDPQHRCPARIGSVRAVAVGDDGTVVGAGHLATALWPAGGGPDVHLLDGLGAVRAAAITPDGTTLVTGTHAGVIQVTRLPSGELLETDRVDRGAVAAVAVSADGNVIVSVGEDHDVREWDRATGLVSMSSYPSDLAVSTGGARPAAHRTAVSPGAVTAASGDGTVLVSGLRRGGLRLDRGSRIVAAAGHGGSVTALAVDSDGATAVSGGSDGTVRVWDLRAGHSTVICDAHVVPITAVGISAAGRAGACADGDGVLHRWRLPVPARGRRVSTVGSRASSAAGSTGPRPGGCVTVHCGEAVPPAVLVIGVDGRVHAVHLDTGAADESLIPDPIRRLTASRVWTQVVIDRVGVCVTAVDGTGYFWRPGLGDEPVALGDWAGLDSTRQQAARARSCLVSGRLLAVEVDGVQPALVDVDSGRRHPLQASQATSRFTCITCGDGGGEAVVVGGTEDGAIHVWTVPDGRLRDVLDIGHRVDEVGLAPGGWLLVSAGGEVIGFQRAGELPAVIDARRWDVRDSRIGAPAR